MKFRTLLTGALLATTVSFTASAFELEAMTDEERTAFQAEIRAYLLENPEVIMEAVAVLEQRQADSQSQNDATLLQVNADAIFDDGFSYIGGNPEGDITLVEFLDYRCGYCRRAHPEVSELVASDGNIRLIIKEYPILGEQSVLASRFTVAVKQLAGDEAYKRASDAIMEMRGDVSETFLSTLAVELGLETTAVFDRMESDEVTAVLQETRALAQRLQISGTPSFIMEDEMLRGYLPLEAMRQLVEQQREG
ncbi:DsbA family protein [Cochlodiniinecator piscidefendens]|uniref:DsbA family protein n=1 Tax=Cochlodiniinecator piscidefendens TaxID=2715756 RepID=UPI00140E527B|nr:DsbA family protein [Cochlodiniinecator piscidefendens]